MNGQLDRVIETPCQRSASAATISAARQCPAWLLPTSATVAPACAAGTPNSQALSVGSIGVHGAFGVISASLGLGVTVRSSRVLWQGCKGSWAAAP
jgi:hypothetical protein